MSEEEQMTRQRFLSCGVGIVLLGALAVALPACGGGGGGGSDDTDDLFLQSFVIVDEFGNHLGGQDSEDVYRNARLLFTFNTAVDMDSVSERTIRIAIPTGDPNMPLYLEALGRFEAVPGAPNQILFNPTSTTPANGEDTPFGFDANAQYDVYIPSMLDSDKYVQGGGKGVVQTFETKFTTGIEYTQDYQQPEFLSSNPPHGATDVDSESDVDMFFDRPMRPDSFVLGDTIRVVNTATGRDIVGTIRVSPDAKTISFRPLIGYGPGPYLIRVTVSRDVISFSGNKIARDVLIEFTTEYDPTQPLVDELEEDFVNNAYEETNNAVYMPTNPRADWNAQATLGLLVGLSGSGQITVRRSTGNFLFPPWGWGANGPMRFQTYCDQNDLGTNARTITGYDWYYNATNSANNASNVSMFLGHTDLNGLTSNWANNFQVGGNVQTPVTVVNNVGTYAIPMGGPSWLAAPPFSANFGYQGGGLKLLLEIQCNAGPAGPLGNPRVTFAGCWGVLTSAPDRRVAYTSVGGTTANLVQYYVDTRWHWLITKSENQSKWYDFGDEDPTYLDVLFVPSIADQPAGTASEFTFEGAHEDSSNPGQPDLINTSGWRSTLTGLSGYRFIRFNVVFTANTGTNQAPSFDKLIFPYIYFQ
jgi:hypothetical protein